MRAWLAAAAARECEGRDPDRVRRRVLGVLCREVRARCGPLASASGLFQCEDADLPGPGDALGAELTLGDAAAALGEACETLVGLVGTERGARNAGGVFYTPGWLIDHVLDAALAPALDEIGDDAARLRAIRVCDPSCGDRKSVV